MVEYRTVERHRITQRCFARPPGAGDSGGWKAIAYDISETGLGVALPLPLKPASAGCPKLCS